MVTGYEDEGAEGWWTTVCGAEAGCRRAFVGPDYGGPQASNLHAFWRCRGVLPDDIELVSVAGEVKVSTSTRFEGSPLEKGDLLRVGSVLHLAPGARVVAAHAGTSHVVVAKDQARIVTLGADGPRDEAPPAAQ